MEGCSIFQQGKIPWKAGIAGGRGGGEVKGTSFNQIQLSVKKKPSWKIFNQSCLGHIISLETMLFC